MTGYETTIYWPSLVNHILNMNIGLWCQNSGCLESACNQGKIIKSYLKKQKTALKLSARPPQTIMSKNLPPSNKYPPPPLFSLLSHILETQGKLLANCQWFIPFWASTTEELMQKNGWLTDTTNYFYLHMLAALLNFFLFLHTW